MLDELVGDLLVDLPRVMMFLGLLMHLFYYQGTDLSAAEVGLVSFQKLKCQLEAHVHGSEAEIAHGNLSRTAQGNFFPLTNVVGMYDGRRVAYGQRDRATASDQVVLVYQ